MKNRYLSVVEVKTHLSACIREIENGPPIVITRYGKPVAALVCVENLAHGGGLADLTGGWEGSEELADILDLSTRR